MRYSLPISPKYDSAFFEAVALQIVVGLVGLMVIDPVGIAQICGIALLAFWGGTTVLVLRRPKPPTKKDLRWIRFGYLPVVIITFFVSVWVWKLRGF